MYTQNISLSNRCKQE